MKKSFCPKCQSVLVVTKTGKMECPDPKCDFVDRRKGNSMLPEALERRGVIYWESVIKFRDRR